MVRHYWIAVSKPSRTHAIERADDYRGIERVVVRTVRRPRFTSRYRRWVRNLVASGFAQAPLDLTKTTALYAASRHSYVCWSPPTHGIDTILEFVDGFDILGRVAGESFSRNKWHRPAL